ncbi:MAG TPA: DUF4388 domain-containing protein [Methylomirabilota bacterium]|nr:DUF4388 domain-containing protein [Methylomirabilota bacterium]
MAFYKSNSRIPDPIPVLGLLQELTLSRRSGVLSLHSGKYSGKIFFDAGCIRNVVLDGKDDLTPEEALREMLHWNEGSFDKFSLQWLRPARYTPKLPEVSGLQNQFTLQKRFKNGANNPCLQLS